MIPWFSKTEGNTYATLLHYPLLFGENQCSAQEVAGNEEELSIQPISSIRSSKRKVEPTHNVKKKRKRRGNKGKKVSLPNDVAPTTHCDDDNCYTIGAIHTINDENDYAYDMKKAQAWGCYV